MAESLDLGGTTTSERPEGKELSPERIEELVSSLWVEGRNPVTGVSKREQLIKLLQEEQPDEQKIEEILQSFEDEIIITNGPSINFLDSVEDAEELDQVKKYLDENGIKYDQALFNFYYESFKKWPDPEKLLPATRSGTEFSKYFPLVYSKIDTPPKIRIFLRCADYLVLSGGAMELAEVLESIISAHESNQKDYVKLPILRYRQIVIPSSDFDYILEMFAKGYGNFRVHSLRKLMMPDLADSNSYSDREKGTFSGNNLDSGVFFDFREETAREKMEKDRLMWKKTADEEKNQNLQAELQ
jgi:hypothetical protein